MLSFLHLPEAVLENSYLLFLTLVWHTMYVTQSAPQAPQKPYWTYRDPADPIQHLMDIHAVLYLSLGLSLGFGFQIQIMNYRIAENVTSLFYPYCHFTHSRFPPPFLELDFNLCVFPLPDIYVLLITRTSWKVPGRRAWKVLPSQNSRPQSKT